MQLFISEWQFLLLKWNPIPQKWGTHIMKQPHCNGFIIVSMTTGNFLISQINSVGTSGGLVNTGSGNGLSPVWYQAFTLTYYHLLSMDNQQQALMISESEFKYFCLRKYISICCVQNDSHLYRPRWFNWIPGIFETQINLNEVFVH